MKQKVFERLVGVLLTPDQFHRLESMAKSHDMTISQVIRRLIDLSPKFEDIFKQGEQSE